MFPNSEIDAPYQAREASGVGAGGDTVKFLPTQQIQDKLAVFVDGCFWHGCPKHATWPKTRAAFWRKKIEGNIARDRRVNRALRERGWVVVRIWEHELKKRDEAKLVRRIRRALAT